MSDNVLSSRPFSARHVLENSSHDTNFETIIVNNHTNLVNTDLEGMDFKSIGKLMGTNSTTVVSWIQTFGKSLKLYIQKEIPDEILHFDINGNVSSTTGCLPFFISIFLNTCFLLYKSPINTGLPNIYVSDIAFQYTFFFFWYPFNKCPIYLLNLFSPE